MNISTANHVITIQIKNSNIPFKYQVNLPRNTPVDLPKAFQRKTNWKYWIKYIKPIWCPQQLALWQSNDCPSASKATVMNMDKYFMWIHYERLHNHNKAKHNKTVCIFLGIYCTCGPQPHITKAASEKSLLTRILMSPYFDFVCS